MKSGKYIVRKVKNKCYIVMKYFILKNDNEDYYKLKLFVSDLTFYNQYKAKRKYESSVLTDRLDITDSSYLFINFKYLHQVPSILKTLRSGTIQHNHIDNSLYFNLQHIYDESIK